MQGESFGAISVPAPGSLTKSKPISATANIYVSDKQVQTDYYEEDVQALFLRKIDAIVGNRYYRSVSPHGKPRLTAASEAI